MDRKALQNLSRQTKAVYQRNAERYARERQTNLFERPWLDRFAAHLPIGGQALDLGCGSGAPIAEYLMGRGFAVTGLDASEAMIGLARTAFPEGDWRLGDMRALDLPETFDGILGWNSFFHLTQDEQRQTLPRIAAHLRPGGILMLTVGPEAGERPGHVGNDAIYHASLSPAEYEQRLAQGGMSILSFVPEDTDCNGHTILLARKAP